GSTRRRPTGAGRPPSCSRRSSRPATSSPSTRAASGSWASRPVRRWPRRSRSMRPGASRRSPAIRACPPARPGTRARRATRWCMARGAMSRRSARPPAARPGTCGCRSSCCRGSRTRPWRRPMPTPSSSRRSRSMAARPAERRRRRPMPRPAGRSAGAGCIRPAGSSAAGSRRGACGSRAWATPGVAATAAMTTSIPRRPRRQRLSSTSSLARLARARAGFDRSSRTLFTRQERAMDLESFRHWSHRAADWAADYRAGLRERPVRSPLRPGEIAARVADSPPERAEPFERIFADFESIVPPGMTHWQHPRFFAYFPSNAAPPAVIAEQLAAAMSTQGMLWQTSPAATELEQLMVDWLRQAVGLPEGFSGVLQDTASRENACAVLTMRETALAWDGNRDGLAAHPQVRIYTSPHAHSSVEKACWIAGIGARNLVQVPTRKDDPRLGIDPRALEAAIAADRRAGFVPAGIVACVGATSIGASDPLREIAAAAKREDLYLHVDAAWAGSAMICPEFREMWDGIEEADSIVFNPHKWLGVPMECSAHFVRDPETLVRTLAIQPEYLKTHGRDGIVNFSEWSVQLGRRFRALKLWFLVRAYGL